MKAPLVDVRNLKKYFPVKKGVFSRVVGQVKAVDDVSFSIAPGETLGLVGESGCGKSTVGRTLLRLLEPTGGSVWLDGQDVAATDRHALRALRSEMQIVFQDPYSSLNPRMTIRAIVEEGLILHSRDTAAARLARVREVLAAVRLDPSYLNRYPHEFSGGQRQRISFARALALRPKFIVLDEPISALDVSTQSEVINLLVQLRKDFALTYLFISHDLSVVEYISDRVAVMYLGEIIETAASGQLYRQPLHPYTHALLSSVPRLEPRKKRRRIILPGDVPSPINPPAGCRFHPRCPLAFEACRTTPPAVIELAGHQVRCHALAEIVATSGADAAAASSQIAAAIAAATAVEAPVG